MRALQQVHADDLLRDSLRAHVMKVSLGLPTHAATAAEAHNRLMLTKALDLSARLHKPVRLPITPDEEMGAADRRQRAGV